MEVRLFIKQSNKTLENANENEVTAVEKGKKVDQKIVDPSLLIEIIGTIKFGASKGRYLENEDDGKGNVASRANKAS